METKEKDKSLEMLWEHSCEEYYNVYFQKPHYEDKKHEVK